MNNPARSQGRQKGTAEHIGKIMQFVASRTRPGLKGRFRSASISRRSHFREAATSLAKLRDIPPRRLVADRKEPARRHRQPSVPFTDATRDAVGLLGGLQSLFDQSGNGVA